MMFKLVACGSFLYRLYYIIAFTCKKRFPALCIGRHPLYVLISPGWMFNECQCGDNQGTRGHLRSAGHAVHVGDWEKRFIDYLVSVL